MANKYSKKRVIQALLASGTQSGAARILGCSRNTIISYIAKDATIHAAVEEARESFIDLAESKLMDNVSEGHPASVFFTLKTLGKSRGYIERVESTGAEGAPIAVILKVEEGL